MTMDARKQRVLQAIVALYGLEGEPVGSSVLANYFDMAVSSATLRNEMAALTKLGLLEQPHTSAGRVPSAKGYRYYLDNLLTDDQPLDRVTRARVDAVFASLDHEPEKLAQGAATALAALRGRARPPPVTSAPGWRGYAPGFPGKMQLPLRRCSTATLPLWHRWIFPPGCSAGCAVRSRRSLCRWSAPQPQFCRTA